LKKHRINKIWIPFWVDKWLFGSTRLELEPDERSVWLDLLALASKNEGYIRANETTPYHSSQLAGLLVITEELLKRTIDKCAEHGKITQLENGTYYIANWEKYQLSGRHKRRFREKKSRIKKKIKEKKREEKSTSKETDGVSDKTDTSTDKWVDKRNKDLQSIIDYAKQRGFGLQGTVGKNRLACYNLMRKKMPDGLPMGVERMKFLIDTAISCRDQRYAPNINDFMGLANKWQNLVAFMDRKKQGGYIG